MCAGLLQLKRLMYLFHHVHNMAAQRWAGLHHGRRSCAGRDRLQPATPPQPTDLLQIWCKSSKSDLRSRLQLQGCCRCVTCYLAVALSILSPRQLRGLAAELCHQSASSSSPQSSSSCRVSAVPTSCSSATQLVAIRTKHRAEDIRHSGCQTWGSLCLWRALGVW